MSENNGGKDKSKQNPKIILAIITGVFALLTTIVTVLGPKWLEISSRETATPVPSNTKATEGSNPPSPTSPPAATETPTEIPLDELLKDFIRGYITHLNNGELDGAWDMLSFDMQSSLRGGKQDYSEYWDSEINSVTIDNLENVVANQSSARIKVTLILSYTDAKKSDASLTENYCMIFNSEKNSWLIDKVVSKNKNC